MFLADVSIKRPVFATMIMAALVVLGLFSYLRLGVDLFPNVDLPIATITTTLRGASPEEVETSITKPIEEVVNTISGIDELRSTSFEGISQVIVSFGLQKNADVGAQEVRDAVARILRELPQGTDPPVIEKFDPGASPIMSIAVSGDRSARDITEIAKKKVKEPLETISGVGKISMIGAREREVHVIINPLRLHAYNISIKDVKEAIQKQNLEVPGGRVDQGRRELVLRTMGRVERPEDFEKIIVANISGVPIRISDIGRVADTTVEPRTLARLDGKSTVSLVIQKQSGTNTVEIISRVKEALEELKPSFPAGIEAMVVRDQSGFIRASLHTVQEHLILGAILASLVVLLFMGSFRSTLIASVSIPISIIATFILMDMFHFTLNNMTLIALALAVGVVIDDAIVVLENIFRHMEEKNSPPLKAASEGTKEIGLAVMATTLSLVIIFLPLAYMPGIVGRFLNSYGLSVAFAIMVSLFVAFTIIPMLCSRFLKIPQGNDSKHKAWVDRLNNVLKEYYGGMITLAMKHRWIVVVASVLIVLSTVPLLKMVGKDFIPPDDSGEFQVSVKAPEGTSLESTDKILAGLEEELRVLPSVKSLLASIGEGDGAGVNDGLIYVRLVDYSERKHNQFEIMAMARHAFSKYAGLRISVMPISAIQGGGFKSTDFNYVISGPDLEKLRDYSGAIVKGLKNVKGIVDVDTSLVYAKPEIKVNIKRDRAQDLGVRVEDIANSLRTMVGGEEDITKYKEGDDLYQVRLRAEEKYRNRPEVIASLFVPSAQKGLVRLDNVAELVEERGPSQIDRINRQRQVTISANLQGVPLGFAIKKADEIAKGLHLPAEYRTGLQGRAKELGRMVNGFLLAFLLSIIFMYMILASQFESFLHPITIMLSLPLSIPFALLSLLIMGQDLNIFSIMGIFMLFGIVKKNAILQIDYTNTLLKLGMPRDQAILESGKTRLRPILMTTLVLVAAMIPVAVGRGPGSANRSAMAVVIVGGQTLCLLITLLITPVAYSLFDDLSSWLMRRFSGKRAPMGGKELQKERQGVECGNAG